MRVNLHGGAVHWANGFHAHEFSSATAVKSYGLTFFFTVNAENGRLLNAAIVLRSGAGQRSPIHTWMASLGKIYEIIGGGAS